MGQTVSGLVPSLFRDKDATYATLTTYHDDRLTSTSILKSSWIFLLRIKSVIFIGQTRLRKIFDCVKARSWRTTWWVVSNHIMANDLHTDGEIRSWMYKAYTELYNLQASSRADELEVEGVRKSAAMLLLVVVVWRSHSGIRLDMVKSWSSPLFVCSCRKFLQKVQKPLIQSLLWNDRGSPGEGWPACLCCICPCLDEKVLLPLAVWHYPLLPALSAELFVRTYRVTADSRRYCKMILPLTGLNVLRIYAECSQPRGIRHWVVGSGQCARVRRWGGFQFPNSNPLLAKMF